MNRHSGHRWLIRALVFAIVGASVSGLAAAQDGSFAGIIVDIDKECGGQIIDVSTKRQSDLDPERDRYRPVASGDRLRCTGAGHIVIKQGPKPADRVIVGGTADFVTVVRSAILNSIGQNFDPAVTRGATGQPIFSPPSGGSVRASDLIVRWNPWPRVGDVTIALRFQKTGERICCDGVVDGKSGHFESPSLRAALIALRQANPEDRELLLNVRSSVSRDFMVEFSVLSAAEEDELDGALRTWQDKDALLLHLGRAHVFSYYRLFTQAAEESEAALALAPASPYLLALAMEAERGTGNSKQLEGLERRLAALPRKDPSR